MKFLTSPIGITLSAIAVVLALLLGLKLTASASSTPDAAALLQQAQEARAAAHKVVCAKLGTYIADCFSGTAEACQKLDSGLAYHDSQFGGDFLKTCRADSSF